MSKKKYQEAYRQREEVKERNAERMSNFYKTEEGQEYEHKKRRTPRSRYTRGAYGAKRRKKVFSLTFDQYVALISLPCEYCKKSIADETGIGLDRIDNTKGYIDGNVNPCCSKCNRIRKDSMGAEEFRRQTKINRRTNG